MEVSGSTAVKIGVDTFIQPLDRDDLVSVSLPNPFQRISEFFDSQEALDLFHQPSPSDKNFDLPKQAIHDLVDLIKETDLRIIVENPYRWMNETPNADAVRALISSVQLSLSVMGLNFEVRRIGKPTETFNPRLAAANEIIFSFHSVDLEQSINPRVARMKETYLPPYFTFDATGFSGWATLANCSQEKLHWLLQRVDGPKAFEFRSLLSRKMKEGLSKYQQPESQMLDIEGPYVFYPMQIATDRVMKLADIEVLDLLNHLVEKSRETGVKLVIKRHPRCGVKATQERLEMLKAENDPLIIFSDAAVSDLITGAQSVVVVNSGVGMESLILGKPVYCSGHSDYHWLTNRVTEPESLRAAFTNPQSACNPDTEAKFIYYYFNEYCVNALNPRQIQRKVFEMVSNWVSANTH